MLESDEIRDAIERLRAEHAQLESQLDALNRRLYLGTREQMERLQIKKLKLLTRDRLNALEPRLSLTRC